MNIRKYQIVNIQAYKHNGYLYRQWNGALVFDITKNYILLVMSQTKVLEEKGQRWRIVEPTIWYFPTDNTFYNTSVLIRKNGYYVYTNLASPFIFEDNTIKFIDYDLDIKHYPKQPTRLVDVDEYKRNIIKYKYPLKLQDKILKTKDLLLKLISNEEFIFSKKTINSYYRELLEDNQISKSKNK